MNVIIVKIMLITNRKERQKMDKDKLLDLYSEDFRYYSDWEDICNILGVDETKTDKVTISYNKVIVNK